MPFMLLTHAVMSTVNLSEVLQKAEQHRIDTEGLEYDLEALGVRLHDFDVRAARAAAELWPVTRSLGLSLGDRACLALARSLGVTALTADTRSAELDKGDLDVAVAPLILDR